MLAPRRGCLGYSKVDCDVKKRWFLAWSQNRHFRYYIFHIQYNNSESSVGLLYVHPNLACWYWLNHWEAPVRSLPTSTFVCASVSFLTYVNHFGAIMVYEVWTLQIPEPFHFRAVLLTRLAWYGMVKAVEQHRRFVVAVWKRRHL